MNLFFQSMSLFTEVNKNRCVGVVVHGSIVGLYTHGCPAGLIFNPIFLPIVQTWGRPCPLWTCNIHKSVCGHTDSFCGRNSVCGLPHQRVIIEQIIGRLLSFFVIIL